MTEKTWFKLYRGWHKDKMFRSDKDKLCWLWLIEHAVYAEKEQFSINNNPITLKRGQLSYSIRYLSRSWAASEQYVRGFLRHLEKWHSISIENGTANNTRQNIITICKYNVFQGEQQGSDTANNIEVTQQTTQGQHRGDTGLTQEQHRSDTNNKKDKKDKKENNINTRGRENPLLKNDKVYSDGIEEAPEWLPKELWDTFVDMREAKGMPLTNLAAKKQLNRLKDAYADGDCPIDVLEKSIDRKWDELYGNVHSTNGTHAVKKRDRKEEIEKLIEQNEKEDKINSLLFRCKARGLDWVTEKNAEYWLNTYDSFYHAKEEVKRDKILSCTDIKLRNMYEKWYEEQMGYDFYEGEEPEFIPFDRNGNPILC